MLIDCCSLKLTCLGQGPVPAILQDTDIVSVSDESSYTIDFPIDCPSS